MMKLAVRYSAIKVNAVREIETIEAQPKNPPHALTGDEVTMLRRSLATDERAVEADLPDLTAFMLGTGVRIGESLAAPWSQVDLEAGTAEITHTIVRVEGQGPLRKGALWRVPTERPAVAAGTRRTGGAPSSACCSQLASSHPHRPRNSAGLRAAAGAWPASSRPVPSGGPG